MNKHAERAVKNGKLGYCFIAEDKPLSPTRTFDRNVKDLGIIVTKKNQNKSLKHRTGGSGLLDLSMVQRGAIEQLKQVLIREITMYGRQQVTAPNAFSIIYFKEYKETGTLLADRSSLVITTVAESISFTPDEKVAVNTLVKRTLDTLNSMDSRTLVEIVMRRLTFPKFQFRTSMDSRTNVSTGSVIDMTGKSNFLKESSVSTASTLKRTSHVLYDDKEREASELFHTFFGDNRIVVLFDPEVGSADADINLMTAEDFQRGETRLVVQDCFWLPDGTLVISNAVFYHHQ